MADSYKLIGGMVLFVLFVVSALAMAASISPDLNPPGSTPVDQGIANAVAKPAFQTSTCGAGDWGCGIVNFFVNIGNGLVAALAIGGQMILLFVALLTFQLPAFQQAGAFGILLNALIVVPLYAVIGQFAFREIKSVIPTVGGDVD